MGLATFAILMCTTLALATAEPAPGAGRDDKARAREHTRQATIAYNIGKYEEAAGEYEAAYRLVQDPALLYNIGQSYRLAGKPDKALAAYKGYLRTSRLDDPNRAAVEGRVAELERAVRAQAPPPPPPSTAPAERAPQPSPFDPEPPGDPAAGGVGGTGPSYPTTAPADPNDPTVVAVPMGQARETSRFRTTAGAHLGWGGRATRNESAVSFRGFGRLGDPGMRVYELGYVRRPVYQVNPVYQYTAVYAVFRSPTHWSAELGGLGAKGEWHLGGGWASGYFGANLRLERVTPEQLCANPNGALVYLVPEARLEVPVTETFKVRGLGVYRGKLSITDCQFRPSQLNLELSAELDLGGPWSIGGGLGHYGLFDFGPGVPTGPWPVRANAAEHVHLAGRYTIGKVALLTGYRFITYAGGTHELTVAVEFRSSPDAP